MEQRALEIKVGLVLLVALLVLGGFVLVLGDLGFERGVRIHVDYAFSGAVQPGAPVKISGVKVGRVERIEFLGGKRGQDGEALQARLVIFISDHAREAISPAAQFYISTQGLLGEHYVEVIPSGQGTARVEDGATFRGKDPPRFDLLVQKVFELLDAITVLIKQDNGELAGLIQSGASVAREMDSIIKESRGDIRHTIAGVAKVTEDVGFLVQGLKTTVGDGTQAKKMIAEVTKGAEIASKDLPQLLEELHGALRQVRILGETLNRIESKELERTLKNVANAADAAERTLIDARQITERIRSGGGTIGLLLNDDEIYDDLKELLRDLKQHPWKLVWKQ